MSTLQVANLYFESTKNNGITYAPNKVIVTTGGTTQATFDGDAGYVTLNNMSANSINGGQLGGFRNKIINGDMAICQRGTTTGLAAAGYYLDRFQNFYSLATGDTTIFQTTLYTPYDFTPTEFSYAYQVKINTIETINATTSYYDVFYCMEGYDARDLIGRTFTLSFWVYSPVAGLYTVAFRNGNASASYLMTYTIGTAYRWEYKTLTVVGGLNTSVGAAGWNWTTGKGLEIVWNLCAGASATFVSSSTNTWLAGNYIAATGQVNALSVASVWELTGVQLEIGSVATPFEHRSPQTELQLCQRYYEKAYNTDVSPGTAYGATGEGVLQCGASGSNYSTTVPFKVSKRSTPTLTAYDAAGTSGKVTYFSAGSPVNGGTISYLWGNESSLGLQSSQASTTGIMFKWTADIEIP